MPLWHSCIHPHQCCSSAPKPFCDPLWKFPGKGPWFCMFKDHLCTCSHSGVFRTLDSLLRCRGSSGLLLLPLPQECWQAGILLHTAATLAMRNSSEEPVGLLDLSPLLGSGTSTLPSPHHQRSRAPWRGGSGAPSRALTGT